MFTTLTPSGLHLFSFIFNFVNFWLGWAFVAVQTFSSCSERGSSPVSVLGLLTQCKWLLWLWSSGCRHVGSAVVVPGL